MADLVTHYLEKWKQEKKINEEKIDSIKKDLAEAVQAAFEAGAEEGYEEGYSDAESEFEDEYLMSNT